LSNAACWALTVLLELPWFLWGFSPRPVAQRCALAVAANLVSYPWVILIFPAWFCDYDRYLACSETFAPVMELLWCSWALDRRLSRREAAAVVLANFTSWLVGIWLLTHLL
jgi:hypothetical protein